MPRVKLDQKRYAREDFIRDIKSKIIRQGLTQSDIAQKMGISQQAFSYKIKHLVFDYNEYNILFGSLDFTDEEIARHMKGMTM